MSRLAYSIKNAKVGVLFHVLTIFVQFFARKIFLDGLGDAFIGTTATLLSFLSFLNLAELGIGTAIGFILYNPIFEKNHKEINQIIRYVGSIYKKIAFLIIAAAIILSLFFPLIFEDSPIGLGIIYYAFFTFLSGSLLGYFFSFHLILLQADQKDYVVTKYFKSFNITKVILQAIFVFYTQSYVIWISLELISAITYTILIRKRINREYPWLKISQAEKRSLKKFQSYPVLLRKIKQISVHKLAGFIVSGTDNILIFYFLNAQSVAFFGNYQMVILNIGVLVDKVFAGSKASVGNLVAENNSRSIQQVFWELMAVRFFIGGLTVTCVYLLIDPFITLWLGAKYILDPVVVLLFCSIFFMRQIMNPVESFKQAYGLYKDTWAPITEGVLNLTTSIFFAQEYGLVGILLGTNVSTFIIVVIWRPIYVYRSGFKKSIRNYVKGFSKLIFITCTAFLLINYIFGNLISLQYSGYFELLYSASLVFLLTTFSFVALLYPTSIYFRSVIMRLKKQFLNN